MKANQVFHPDGLEKCPFCDHAAFLQMKVFKLMSDIPGRQERQRGKIYWVGCDNPYCWQPKTFGPDEETTRKRWNTRPLMTQSHYLNCQDVNCEKFACVARRDYEQKILVLEDLLRKVLNSDMAQMAEDEGRVCVLLGEIRVKVT